MVLSWNEIKERALAFSKEWAGTTNEEADAKPFLVEFFNVFGISHRKVSTFEHRVKKLDESDGYIDLLWKGTIVIEMKSRGKNLDRAIIQAKDYLHGLKQHELPRYILVCDFDIFRLLDIEEQTEITFKLDELVQNVQHFGFLIGYQKKVYKEQDPANIKAAELMGKLHDRLEEIGYTGHPLEVYLVRLLFCLFADDTTIFNKDQFQDYIEQRTNSDGSDLAAKLQELFQVLNTPRESRFKNLDEQLADFPYVNGQLFEELLPMASFDTKMRQALIDCCMIDWSQISPAIFGSMFQSVMNPKERRDLGAHYTSETNILKLIKPLFLDELWAEFNNVKSSRNKLMDFHKKLSMLKFLDPACGCGNFLVITYRELRLLELEILRQLFKGQTAIGISEIIWLDVDMMYGIEYEEFPARIAEVAMWLIDHQMNMMISHEFGQYFVRLPLKKAAKIVKSNALRIEWSDVVNPDELSFIIGNPPFIGKHYQTREQSSDMDYVFGSIKGIGVLDYVSAWYYLAAKLAFKRKLKAAFVSTNSITQGEQVGILWNILMSEFNIKIHFAHRTFNWKNEARGNAAVHVVIVGFAAYDTHSKVLFEYESIRSLPYPITARNINPYLIDAKDLVISSRENSICDVPKIVWGNKPVDGGHLIIEDEELSSFLDQEPTAAKFIKPLISAKEFLSGKKRWCLWLVDAKPEEIKSMPYVLERVRKVREMRLDSVDEGARNLASRPFQFRDLKNPERYILIPSTTSENRKYIPFAFFKQDNIPHNSCHIIPNGELYHFGILMSEMHMAWVKTTCGRLKSDYRYSKDIVYNNFPWPLSPLEKHVENIEQAAENILRVRDEYPQSSLADLYDPLLMPSNLVKAHQVLDRAVDLAYRPQAFTNEANRMAFLFELYEKYTADLFSKENVKKKRPKVV